MIWLRREPNTYVSLSKCVSVLSNSHCPFFWLRLCRSVPWIYCIVDFVFYLYAMCSQYCILCSHSGVPDLCDHNNLVFWLSCVLSLINWWTDRQRLPLLELLTEPKKFKSWDYRAWQIGAKNQNEVDHRLGGLSNWLELINKRTGLRIDHQHWFKECFTDFHLSRKLWLDKGLLVKPDSIDSPHKGQRQPAKVEVFLAKLDLFFWGHFRTF